MNRKVNYALIGGILVALLGEDHNVVRDQPHTHQEPPAAETADMTLSAPIVASATLTSAMDRYILTARFKAQ